MRLAVCPHCLATPASMAHHTRDTGDAVDLPPRACPVLFQRRNANRAYVTNRVST